MPNLSDLQSITSNIYVQIDLDSAMQNLHDLQTLRDRLRSMPARLTLHIGPYTLPLQGGADPVIQQFAADFVEDLLTIVEVRIAELSNQSSHEQPRLRTPDLGPGSIAAPAQ